MNKNKVSEHDSFCKWEEDEYGTWNTACDNLFFLNDGTPEDNDMKYCCYCGKQIKEIVFEDEGDD